MKVNRTGEKVLLQLANWEKHLLIEVLNLYPRVPSAHLAASKSGVPESSQQLLDEALKEQRAENKQQVQALLTEPLRWTQTEVGCNLSLSVAELEWLLQVLNDIRVGSWVLLGSPESEADLELEVISATMAEHFWAIEHSGYFQQHLLVALDG